jgi:hypothetical protein
MGLFWVEEIGIILHDLFLSYQWTQTLQARCSRSLKDSESINVDIMALCYPRVIIETCMNKKCNFFLLSHPNTGVYLLPELVLLKYKGQK